MCVRKNHFSASVCNTERENASSPNVRECGSILAQATKTYYGKEKEDSKEAKGSEAQKASIGLPEKSLHTEGFFVLGRRTAVALTFSCADTRRII